MTIDYLIGAALAQRPETTALAVIERDRTHAASYSVRYLERLAPEAALPAIIARVGELAHTKELLGRCYVVVDLTALGEQVLRLLTQAGLQALGITLTGEGTVGEARGRHRRVPKRDVVTATQVALQTGRLRVAEELPEAATLLRELLAFRVSGDPLAPADAAALWRERSQDDLVLAVAPPLWYSEVHRGYARLGREGGGPCLFM
jgi:hypothetical protein